MPPVGQPTAGSGPDFDDLKPELQARLLSLVPKLIALGMGRTYSAEDPADGCAETSGDYQNRTAVCRAVCCSYRFALTREESERGDIRFDEHHPCFIAQGPDGYCIHHDPEERRCTIWENRPLRCRRYSCLAESSIWKEGDPLAMLPGTFDHLPRPESDESSRDDD